MSELLDAVSSRELAELRAYEVKNGPIGPHYNQEVLASIHEVLQLVVQTLRQVNVKDPEDVPDIVRYPRPYEVHGSDEGE